MKSLLSEAYLIHLDVTLKLGDKVRITKTGSSGRKPWDSGDFEIDCMRYCSEVAHKCGGCRTGIIVSNDNTGVHICLASDINRVEHLSNIINKVVVV